MNTIEILTEILTELRELRQLVAAMNQSNSYN